MNNIFVGGSYLIRGFGFLTKTGIKRFVIIPALINIVVFIGLFFLLKHFFHELNMFILSLLPTWLQWLSIVFWLVFIAGFFLFFVYAFVAVGNIIASPFNSFLAEKVEELLTAKKHKSQPFLQTVRDIPRIISRQFSIIFYYLLRVLLLVILIFVPIIHFFVPMIWFLFSAWFMAITYLDYPSDNHRVSITEVREWLKENYWTSFGFGCTVLFASMIPILNFFVMPAAVAGATLYWVEFRKE